MKTQLYARESVAFDEIVLVRDTAGAPVDITGWTFSVALARHAGQTDLELATVLAGEEGFTVVDGPAGGLRLRIEQETLSGIEDTTGNFTMWGDLLGTAPGDEDAHLVADLRLSVTVAGEEFQGRTYSVTVDALAASVIGGIAAAGIAAAAEAQAWAEGTEPGGPGTFSAREGAERATDKADEAAGSAADAEASAADVAIALRKPGKVLAGAINPYFEYDDGSIEIGAIDGDLWVRGVSLPTQLLIAAGLSALGASFAVKQSGWPALVEYDLDSGRVFRVIGTDNEAHWYGHFKGAVEAVSWKGASLLKSDGRSLFAARAKLAAKKALGTGVTRIGITGDSWDERRLIPQALADLLYAEYGRSGDGWLSFNNPTSWGLNTAIVEAPGFTYHDLSEEAASGQYSPDGMRWDATGTTATAGGTGIKATSLKIYYLDTTGTFRYRVDGGSWTTVAGGGTGNPAKVTISGLASGGTHTFDIDLAGNAGTVSLFGVYAQHTDPGVELNKLGNGGITAPQLASAWTTAAAYIAADLAPDAMICILGTNDNRLSVLPSAHAAGLSTIADGWRTANASAGLVFATPPVNGVGGTYPMTDYRDRMVDVATSKSADFLNLTSAWSDWTTMSALGVWAAGDDGLLHVSAAGARWIASDLYSMFKIN